MPRGDEFEPGEPRRRSGKSPRYDDDYDDRDDRARDRDDVRRSVPKNERSGTVLAVGIMGIILGTLQFSCGTCNGLCGAALTGGGAFIKEFQQQLKAQAAVDPNADEMAKQIEQAQGAGWLIVTDGVCNMIWGLGLVASGIGVLMRSNLSRFVLLFTAVADILESIAAIVGLIVLGLFDSQNAIYSIALTVLTIAFLVFAAIVLVNPKNGRTFTRF